MPLRLCIIDYGSSNLRAVQRRAAEAGADAFISHEAAALAKADKIILPGVGHFGRAMDKLRELHLNHALQEAVLHYKKPVLGICLGMQLLAGSSEEAAGQSGLGWIPGRVLRLQVPDTQRYKVPHIGWNSIDCPLDSPLNKGLDADSQFYFSHSYCMRPDDATIIIQNAFYGESFAAAINWEHIFGVQYHPEKSHAAGLQVLKNFVQL